LRQIRAMAQGQPDDEPPSGAHGPRS
jgi:hypothetical protein